MAGINYTHHRCVDVEWMQMAWIKVETGRGDVGCLPYQPANYSMQPA
jgi:hypothetical protein